MEMLPIERADKIEGDWFVISDYGERYAFEPQHDVTPLEAANMSALLLAVCAGAAPKLSAHFGELKRRCGDQVMRHFRKM